MTDWEDVHGWHKELAVVVHLFEIVSALFSERSVCCKCHKFGYEYVMKVLINLRVAGNSMYFVTKITSLWSHDFEDVMNKVMHV